MTRLMLPGLCALFLAAAPTVHAQPKLPAPHPFPGLTIGGTTVVKIEEIVAQLKAIRRADADECDCAAQQRIMAAGGNLFGRYLAFRPQDGGAGPLLHFDPKRQQITAEWLTEGPKGAALKENGSLRYEGAAATLWETIESGARPDSRHTRTLGVFWMPVNRVVQRHTFTFPSTDAEAFRTIEAAKLLVIGRPIPRRQFGPVSLRTMYKGARGPFPQILTGEAAYVLLDDVHLILFDRRNGAVLGHKHIKTQRVR